MVCPLLQEIVLFMVGHWVEGIRPRLFLFASCSEDNSFADQALRCSSAPSCTTERPLALLLSWELQVYISAAIPVHCFGKYFESENSECPLLSFYFHLAFAFLVFLALSV